MNELLKTLTARGLLQDATSGLDERLERGPIVAYVGLDPTADSLHVGSLVPIIGAAWLQHHGHTPIVLMGGGTGMVGDPSGKRAERPVMPVEEVDRNVQAIARQVERFLDFGKATPNPARLRNNAEWLRRISLMEFLRDTGKHLTLGFMLQKESVRSRMETGISYTEFSYMAIQAYDFWHLFRAEQCELQIGGSDQWGNITAGIELIGKREGRQTYGLVFPLVTNTSGAKFGKSEAGNIWLDPSKTSPYQFYQFWINTDDRDVERYLKLFTFLPLEEIGAAMAEQAREPGKRPAQRLLARDLTTRVHGPDAAQEAIRTSGAMFGSGEKLDAESGIEIPSLPTKELSSSVLKDGVPVIDLLVASGLASSRADARRGIHGRGFYLNGQPIQDVELRIGPESLQGPPEERFVILRKGKKNYMRVVFTTESPSAPASPR
jgi:tyrosyl-tRNA synthetase